MQLTKQNLLTMGIIVPSALAVPAVTLMVVPIALPLAVASIMPFAVTTFVAIPALCAIELIKERRKSALLSQINSVRRQMDEADHENQLMLSQINHLHEAVKELRNGTSTMLNQLERQSSSSSSELITQRLQEQPGDVTAPAPLGNQTDAEEVLAEIHISLASVVADQQQITSRLEEKNRNTRGI